VERPGIWLGHPTEHLESKGLLGSRNNTELFGIFQALGFLDAAYWTFWLLCQHAGFIYARRTARPGIGRREPELLMRP
jgi:hypothetical protein